MRPFVYRTEDAELTRGLSAVRARYDAIANDVDIVASLGAPVVPLSLELAVVLATEARLLDEERWHDWLGWCDDEAVLWVPLDTRTPHPAADQSLFLDDRRRLEERVWRFTDPNAWALTPSGRAIRAVSGVEAWHDPDEPSEALVSSVLTLQHVRGQNVFATVGRQVHRLRRRDADRWSLLHKVLLLPQLDAGTPHLGWLM
ncbi:MAG: aromatic-ring-hydroxylating dioxygenase subunit beta [Microbacterium sp.]|uniref:aromatic-ring-hydroxylating dioxygenase subunit beta n=1 Tax=Microbacterium sp. TaxID=51671 RepID=UPI0039E54A18